MSENTAQQVEFYRKFETLLGASNGSIHGADALSELQSWDSLMILEFMILANSDYGVDIEPSDIAACTTVADLAHLVLKATALPRVEA